MEFFHGVNIDWMGKAKYFVALSLLLLAVGWISILRNHGLFYGIDFAAGRSFTSASQARRRLTRFERDLTDAGIHNSTVRPIMDMSDANSKNDIVISLDQNGQGDEELDTDRQAILGVLQKTMGTSDNKSDLNSASPAQIAAYLTQKDPLTLGTAAGDRYNQLAQRHR